LSDAEFDLLKEDLTWNGSTMVIMNRKEASYLKAVEEYLKGNPTMSDKEFDTLKKELMEEGSKFAVQTEPKCYIDTGICKVTLLEDKFRSNLLYLPAGVLLTLVWLGFGYEVIEPVIRINPVFLTLLGTPFIYFVGKFITEELVFQNKFVAFGPCPNCQAENRVYFGSILGVEGFTDVAQAKCPNCKEVFTVQRNTLRASTIVGKDIAAMQK
jgi:Zn ribbon nucleic-acid-binding protein